MEWSKQNLIAIHLNSKLYFYKDNTRVDDFIDFNKYNNGFHDNFLLDLKFNYDGNHLLFAEKNNSVSLYDIGKCLLYILIIENKKFLQKMNLSIGEVTCINWTSNNSFFLADRLGMVHFFDTRCSFKNNTSIDKIDSSLSRITTSKFCKENNMIAFGNNQSKVLLFDIRNIRKKYKEFNLSCSKTPWFL